ncbi:hypothetical protein QBC40DRAFT_322390 [Triangularia verruculosa]|uniref:DUF8004 domain-containing protein n=1 Tax=Triangularia verruculosa TaxID=2587418 RepID=A0AAN6XQR6_9PEZI|nr:hypothetical protein QBC40DRAFT_322390 [Triangularia verruculosa]
MERPSTPISSLKRWGGDVKGYTAWDSLRRDPELWSRDGNCLVHLYEKGASRRGPSFKVNLDVLFAAKCHPLVARYAVRGTPDWTSSDAEEALVSELMGEACSGEKNELYIPVPASVNKTDTRSHQITIRNLFAWVFRKPVVGEHLGSALIGLLNSLTEHRGPDEDNMDSVLGYMDELQYLDMSNRPYHALALAHFAEHFRLKDLYTDALCHCVGMYEQLYNIPEFQIITSPTRKLIRQVKTKMDTHLGKAGQLLRDFLDSDFPEGQLKLTPGERSHLKHFRAFLTAYFTKRLGRYPPASIGAPHLVFERDVYVTMHRDFDALYQHLADTTLSVTSMPTLTHLKIGGTVLQIIHGFDERNKFTPLDHPLPLIPEIVPKPATRKISWLSRSDKLKPNQTLVEHASLIKATNKQKALMSNPLVIAYRKLEEDAVFFPPKADRNEKLTHADTRKARWVLIYCIGQLLRSCKYFPPTCGNVEGVKYNVAIDISTIIHPWGDEPESPSPPALACPTSKRSNTLTERPSSPILGARILPEPKLSVPPSYDSLLTMSSSNYTPVTLRSPVGSLSARKRHHFRVSSSFSKATPLRTSSGSSQMYHHPNIPMRVGSTRRGSFRRPSCHTFGPIDKYSVEDLKPLPLSLSARGPPTTPSYSSSTDDSTAMGNDTGSSRSSSNRSSSGSSGGDSIGGNSSKISNASTELTTPDNIKATGLSVTSAPDILSGLAGLRPPPPPPQSALPPLPLPWPPHQGQLHGGRRSKVSLTGVPTTYGQRDGGFNDLEASMQKMVSSYSMCTLSSSVYSDDVQPPHGSNPMPGPPPLPKKSSRRKLPGLHPRPLRIRKVAATVGLTGRPQQQTVFGYGSGHRRERSVDSSLDGFNQC